MRSDVARETLIFHELGHCLLGRNHTDSLTTCFRRTEGLSFSAPSSLMNTRGVSADLDSAH